jgi:hypothetical protein
MKISRRLEREHGFTNRVKRWEKESHLARMGESGAFRFVRECLLHHTDEGDAERIVGVFLSQGQVHSLLEAGVSEEDLRIDRLRQLAERALGSVASPWFWSVRVRIGIV